MKTRLLDYLKNFADLWRARAWPERIGMLSRIAIPLTGLLLAFWLALWLFLGFSSVEIEEVSIKLDRGLSVAGTDRDANGIRDDIDEYIRVLASTKGYDAMQTRALQQEARAMQGLMTVVVSDTKQVMRAVERSDQAGRCLFLSFHVKREDWSLASALKDSELPFALGTQIEHLTVNTKPRAIAYAKLNHALDGTAWQSVEGDTCEP